jgi:hypothetical protein
VAILAVVSLVAAVFVVSFIVLPQAIKNIVAQMNKVMIGFLIMVVLDFLLYKITPQNP